MLRCREKHSPCSSGCATCTTVEPRHDGHTPTPGGIEGGASSHVGANGAYSALHIYAELLPGLGGPTPSLSWDS